jgi:rhodanese-related sulfurtransferase
VGPTRWTVEDVEERIDRGEAPVFVDTRNPTAWAESDVMIPGALRIPLEELHGGPQRAGGLETRVDSIPRGRPVVTYCT